MKLLFCCVAESENGPQPKYALAGSMSASEGEPEVG